jgi:hypothetical protein
MSAYRQRCRRVPYFRGIKGLFSRLCYFLDYASKITRIPKSTLSDVALGIKINRWGQIERAVSNLPNRGEGLKLFNGYPTTPIKKSL